MPLEMSSANILLSLSDLDKRDDTVLVSIGDGKSSGAMWIEKEEAQQIISHLQKEFGL